MHLRLHFYHFFSGSSMSSALNTNFSDELPKKVGNTHCSVPIPNNRSCSKAKAQNLPPQVRDLAELLAQIAADDFLQMKAARKDPGQ